jgi:hypothetical protein
LYLFLVDDLDKVTGCLPFLGGSEVITESTVSSTQEPATATTFLTDEQQFFVDNAGAAGNAYSWVGVERYLEDTSTTAATYEFRPLFEFREFADGALTFEDFEASRGTLNVWEAGQPSLDGRLKCVGMNTQTGLLQDMACDVQQSYVCKRPRPHVCGPAFSTTSKTKTATTETATTETTATETTATETTATETTPTTVTDTTVTDTTGTTVTGTSVTTTHTTKTATTGTTGTTVTDTTVTTVSTVTTPDFCAYTCKLDDEEEV